MNKNRILCVIAALTALVMTYAATPQRLVILHTNDTHSAIDPTPDSDLGGILRRKVIIDSIRACAPDVLLIDAGDAVQGTLYFNLYNGHLEQKLMNALGYDIRIIGNHEFDNGIDSLASFISESTATRLCTNYDLRFTPLKGLFKSYEIRQYGNRRIGFIGINVDPEGLIAPHTCPGVIYEDAIKSANVAAHWLKDKCRVDAVVAITHIGYDENGACDLTLAKLSSDIDIIIGGHSHTMILPDAADDSAPHPWVTNSKGAPVLVTQVKSSGTAIGEIDIDLTDMSKTYRVHKIDSRLDARIDKDCDAMIAPYRAGVDSLLYKCKVGVSACDLPKESTALLNFAADFMYDCGASLAADIDFAIINKGGLRCSLPKGDLTEGRLIMLMPFNNFPTVIDIKGSDLVPAIKQMCSIGGNGVSRNVSVRYDSATGEPIEITINGRPLNPDSTYRVATIDYLANGGDYMPSLACHNTVAMATRRLYFHLIDYVKQCYERGIEIAPSDEARFVAQ
ncbi:MAG: bifunctional metallophosphatase/5'-nucleotidase [Muribaculaceae bacterium]